MPASPVPRRKSQCPFVPGNALLEYVLPVAIIGSLLLVSIDLMKPDFRGAFAGFFSADRSLKEERTLNIRSVGSNPYMETLKLVLADGTVIAVPDYPGNLSKVVEVDGADGTTTNLANTLQTLAKTLRDAGKITDDQYNRLEKLSNSAHTMAASQRILEEVADSAGTDKSLFLAKKFYVPGMGMQNAAELSTTLALSDTRSQDLPNMSAVSADIFANLVELGKVDEHSKEYDIRYFHGKEDFYAGNQLQGFLREYQSVKDSGLLNDPALSTLVRDLSTKIFQISVNFSGAVSQAVTPQKQVENHLISRVDVVDISQTTPDRIRELTASRLTNTHAGDLCQAGEGTDTGVYCPKNKN